jgi:hypothetical protein
MSFLRDRGVYQSDEIRKGRDSKAAPLLIGVDEPPAGYSLTSCSPALLVSASPANNNLAITSGRCQQAIVSASFDAIGLHQAITGLVFRASAITLANPVFCPMNGGNPTPHSALLTPHSSLFTPHSSLLTPHSSLSRFGLMVFLGGVPDYQSHGAARQHDFPIVAVLKQGNYESKG